MLSRRSVLAGAGLAALMPLMPRRVHAMLDLGGGARLESLSDGTLVLPGDFILGGMPQDELAELLRRHDLPRDQLTPPVNVTLLRDGPRTVLFDAGAGHDFMETAGRLPESLAELGVAPEDVTHVVISHAHPDHVWGLLDDFDDPMFPNARHLIGADELAYWTEPATFDSIGVARQSFVAGARRRLEAVEDMLETFETGAELLPGVVALLTPGHTPGHMSFEVAGRVLVLGDAIGNHHVGFERPGWASGSDQDPEAAAATRVALLDRVVADDLVLFGTHLPGKGIGRALRHGDAYRYLPDES